jgi:hypothetical protein
MVSEMTVGLARFSAPSARFYRLLNGIKIAMIGLEERPNARFGAVESLAIAMRFPETLRVSYNSQEGFLVLRASERSPNEGWKDQ